MIVVVVDRVRKVTESNLSFLCRRRCDSNDQFASFESDDVELGSDLSYFDWIEDAESFLCSDLV